MPLNLNNRPIQTYRRQCSNFSLWPL